VLLALVLAAVTVGAQEPVFEAASIRLNRDGGPVSGLRRSPGGRFDGTNVPLAVLISFAYQLQPFELQGGPPWLTSDRWDIVAKIDGDPPPTPLGTPDAMALAMRALLADRFKLVLRRDMREQDVYQLVMARADRQPGPGLRQSSVDCLAIQQAADAARKGGPAAPNPNTSDTVVCGIRNSGRRLQFGGSGMSMVTSMLTSLSQRRVVDRTGLTGNWQFDISFRPEQPTPGPPGEPASGDADAPSLFTVLQEQLGLKLESATMPMPVMVVERVERPTED
jgi:uncharacterized protein (TIGR03435 family)